MKITYKTFAWRRDGKEHEVTLTVCDKVEFIDGKVKFNWMGSSMEVDVEHLVSIEA